jgi:hypothetical protein
MKITRIGFGKERVPGAWGRSQRASRGASAVDATSIILQAKCRRLPSPRPRQAGEGTANIRASPGKSFVWHPPLLIAPEGCRGRAAKLYLDYNHPDDFPDFEV